MKLRREGVPWEEITKVFPGRSARALKMRFKILSEGKSRVHPESLPKSKKMDRWTDEQDEMLVQLMLEGKSWEEIAAALPPPGRTPYAAKGRYRNLRENSNINALADDKSYKPEDDQMLLKLRWEGKSWNEITKALSGPERSLDSVRKRYHKLKKLHGLEAAPTEHKRTTYTPEEERRLVRLKESGKSWKEISEAFPGHSFNSLKVRYHQKLKSERKPIE